VVGLSYWLVECCQSEIKSAWQLASGSGSPCRQELTVSVQQETLTVSQKEPRRKKTRHSKLDRLKVELTDQPRSHSEAVR